MPIDPEVKVLDKTALTDPRVYNARPRGDADLIGGGIVLHHTGGTNSLWWLSQWHANPVSTHKLFNKVGWIYKIVPDNARAWHAGASEWGGREDWNDFSLGYEIENMGDGADEYTRLQYEAVAASIAYDTALYHIGDKWVRTHREIGTPRGRKVDPVGLDLDRLWARVSEIRREWPRDWGIPLWYGWEGGA
jgi:N-acetyl-anhydromuramyl-L-alanine amidase AmpD